MVTATAAVEDARDEDEGIYIRGQPTTLMKQAQKYARQVATDVRIFDWNTMFLAYFTSLDGVSGPVEAVLFDERALRVCRLEERFGRCC
jgi:hypothetical protein